MSKQDRNIRLDRRDELLMLAFAVIVALMLPPALLGVL